MISRKFILTIIFAGLLVSACDMGFEENDPGSDSGNSTETPTDNSISDADKNNSEDFEEASDYSWSSSTEVQITLNGSSVTVNGSGATAKGGKVTISEAGNYSISGTLNDGQIMVDTEDEEVVRLILNGASISCSNSAPVYVKNASKVIVNLAEGTENTLTDGTSYNTEDDEPNAAIFSKENMTIFGEGSLTVNANFNDGITSKDGLIIKSGTINVTAEDDGVRGKDFLIVKGGTMTIVAGGDGLKSDNEDEASCGYISIETGTFDITAAGDGIQAETDVLITDGDFAITTGGGSSRSVSSTNSAKGIKAGVELIIEDGDFSVSSADDALHTNGGVFITKGTFALASADDGIHADYSVEINGGDIDISKSYEAIESSSITVNGGNITMVASDDGFNATSGRGGESDDGSLLTIAGGYIAVNASGGDGIDSNGSMEMTGGTVIVHGPKSSPEVGMDVNGNIEVTDGFLLISGTNSNMTQTINTSSSQYSVLIFFSSSISSSNLFHIEDSEGNNMVTFQPVRSYYSMIYSSPDLEKGKEYTIYTGGNSTGTIKDGLYIGGTYSGGTEYSSFTISNVVTQVGSGSSGGGGPGGGFGGW